MRFCKQRDRYSCGPIALININKFFGKHATYKDLPRYQKRVRCRSPHGTYTRNISKVVGRARRKAWQQAKRFMENGCILIQNKRIGHYYLMVMVGGQIGVVNLYRDTVSAIKVSPQWASRHLRDAFRTWYVNKPINI